PHTCSNPVISQDHKKLSYVLISKNIHTLIDNDSSTSMLVLIAHIKSTDGYTMTYRKASVAKQKAIENIYGNLEEKDSGGSSGVDQEKVLKVSWEKVGEDYSADKLRELFSKFGEVEDVVIKGSKKKGSALVVMAIKEGAVAATGSVIGHLANPLLVVPLKPASVADSSSVPKSAETTRMSNLVGAGYQAFEDSVLKKLQKPLQCYCIAKFLGSVTTAEMDAMSSILLPEAYISPNLKH
ncbi:hypothetical protein glysoja_015396, partial [Glycine soja]